MAGRPSKLPPELVKVLADRYLAGEGSCKLAKEVGVHVGNLQSAFKRLGIKMYQAGGSPETDESTQVEICRLYQKEKMGATSIGRQFGVDKGTIYNILHRRGIGTRPRSNRCGDDYHVREKVEGPGLAKPGERRKYTLNETVFDNLESPDARYWAGYLITDGCVYENHGDIRRLGLRQARKHRRQCEQLAQFLETNIPIDDYSKETFGAVREFSFLQITSKRICDQLLKYGIFPAKTKIANPADFLVNDCDFWRGVIDGDGSVYDNKIRCNSSSPRVANAFRRFAIQLCSIPKMSFSTNQAGVYMVDIGVGRSVGTLARLLYGGSPKYYLEQKMINAKMIIERYS